MSLKGDCKLPNIWVPGTISPYTKGYCTTQKEPPNYDILSYECKHPKIWVPGTKNPKTKGFCATPLLKSNSPKPKSPVKSKTPPKPKSKSKLQSSVKSPPKKLIDVNLSGKNLTEFPRDLLENAPTIQTLNLYSNKLTQIPKEIGDMVNLKELNLGKNPFTQLPKEVGKLKNLEKLTLFTNEITQLPKEIWELTNLKELVVENKITQLPKEIGKLKNLEKLSTHGAKLTQLPKEIGELTNLKELILMDNELTQIPEEVGNLKNLTTLGLSHNKLTSIPKEVGNLRNLEILYLGGNKLRQIPKEIANLMNLQQLELSDNNLTQLPKEMYNLKGLEYFNIKGNKNLTQVSDKIYDMGQEIELDTTTQVISKSPPKVKSKSPPKVKSKSPPKVKSKSPSKVKSKSPLKVKSKSPPKPIDAKLSITFVKPLDDEDEFLDFVEKYNYDFGDLTPKIYIIYDLDDNYMEFVKDLLIKYSSDIKVIGLFTKGNPNPEILYDEKKGIFLPKSLSPKVKSTMKSPVKVKSKSPVKFLPPKIKSKSPVKIDYLSLKYYNEQQKSLTLVNMNLTHLPESIKSLAPTLKLLFVQINQITELPEWISTFTNLEKLSISANPIKKLPNSIDKLQKLHTLSIMETKITSLPESMKNMPNLDVVYYGDYEDYDYKKIKNDKSIDELNIILSNLNSTSPSPKVKSVMKSPSVTDDMLNPIEMTYLKPKTSGSSKGGIYKDKDGNQWLIKEYNSNEQAKNEYLAYRFYQLANIDTPIYKLMNKDGKCVIGSKCIKLSNIPKSDYPKLWSGFALDAWLANWDVIGADHDNVMKGTDGTVYRVDLGGSLLYRAMGGKKILTNDVIELNTMRDKSTNMNAWTVFKDIPSDVLFSSIQNVLTKITPSKIDELVGKYGPKDTNENSKLKHTLKSRLEYYKAIKKESKSPTANKQAPIQIPQSKKPHEYHPESATLMKPNKYTDMFKVQTNYVKNLDSETIDAIKYYTGSGYNVMNNLLRQNKMQFKTNDIVKKINLIDRAFRNAPPLKQSMVVYRGINLNYKINQDFIDKGYVSTSADKNKSLAFNQHKKNKCCFFEIYLPKGSRVLPLVSISHYKEEMEILLCRNSLFQIVKQDFTPTGNTIITKYVEHIPTTPFELTPVKIDQENWKQISDTVLQDENGCNWGITNYSGNVDRMKNEYLGYVLYLLNEIPVRQLKLIHVDDQLYLATKDMPNVSAPKPDDYSKFWPGFIVDCWLANWNVLGYNMTNIKMNNGKAIRMDVSGVMKYRATGGFKPFTPKVTELNTFLDSSKNKDTAVMFDNMDESVWKKSVAKLASIDDSKIQTYVNTFGPGTDNDKQELFKTLVARKKDLI